MTSLEWQLRSDGALFLEEPVATITGRPGCFHASLRGDDLGSFPRLRDAMRAVEAALPPLPLASNSKLSY